MPQPSTTLQPTGLALAADLDIALVMMFRTQELLVADTILRAWQHVVEQTLLPNQFHMLNLSLLLTLLLKDTVQKRLLPRHYGAAPPEKETSPSSSPSMRTQG